MLGDGAHVPQAALHYVALNLKTPQLTNVKVRQALHYLIDYQGMVDSFLKGQFQIHQAFWPSGFSLSSQAALCQASLDEARSLK